MYFGRYFDRGVRWDPINGCFGNPWMMAGMGLLLLGLIILIVVLVRRRPNRRDEQLLNEKLARSEITLEEYRQRRDILREK